MRRRAVCATMVFTLIIVSLGGLFLVGYGVWAIAENRRGSRPRNRIARRGKADDSSGPADATSPLLWSTWGDSSSGSSYSSSSSEAYAGPSSEYSGGGSCDCGGSDSSGSSSCDSGGGGSSSSD